MNEHERLTLQKMLQSNDAENNTNKIRTLKHSKLILNDVDNMLKIKKEYSRLAISNPSSFDNILVNKCQFLFNNYTDIFNKVKKDEIDLSILVKLLNVLHAIEEGNLDQHEGSVHVGKLLKDIYIDSALKKADNLDKKQKNSQKNVSKKIPPKNITWEQFKNNKL
jgi:hypothetical protein